MTNAVLVVYWMTSQFEEQEMRVRATNTAKMVTELAKIVDFIFCFVYRILRFILSSCFITFNLAIV